MENGEFLQDNKVIKSEQNNRQQNHAVVNGLVELETSIGLVTLNNEVEHDASLRLENISNNESALAWRVPSESRPLQNDGQQQESKAPELAPSTMPDEVDYLPSYETATRPIVPYIPEPSAPPLFLENESEGNYEHSINESFQDFSITNQRTVHLSKSTLKNVSVRVNLMKAARFLLKVLEQVEYEDGLYEGGKVTAAIYRYEHLWLPLVSDVSLTSISPPLDVYWVWIVHMLAPQYYVKDCMTIIGKIKDHRLKTSKSLERSMAAGKETWEKLYPNEPWQLRPEDLADPKYANAESQITYNLEEAIKRQSAFYYQVSLMHYKCKPFLYKAIYRYKQFLALKRLNPELFLVPCYDMDIIWHAHQVHPLIYKTDTERILGNLFPHDDSVNDRSDGSKLNVSDTVTRDLWLKTFGTTFRREGAMYRGDPPSKYISELPESVEQSSHSSLFHVQLTKIQVNGNFASGPLKIKLKREGEKLAEFTLVQSSVDSPLVDITEMNLNFSIFESVLNNWVVLKISSTKVLKKFLKMFGKGTFWSMTNLCDLFAVEDEGTLVKTFCDEESSDTVELEMSVKREYTSNWVPIGIMTGEFLPCVLDPQELKAFYGMVTGSKSDNQDIYLAEMATHRLLNESPPMKPQLVEVEVCHSRHFLFSSVKIFADSSTRGRSLVGLAHTIDLNTVPSPSELKKGEGTKLSSTVATLDIQSGERMMVIKTQGRDWSLVSARWEGLRRGVKGTFSSRGVAGCPGWLVVKVFCPIGASPYTVKLPYDKHIFAFQLPNLFIDMENGILKISRETEDLVEHIALGLAITTLHVLCQPRFDMDYVDGEDAPSILPNAPKRIPTEKLKFLAALGFFCASAPTNTALRRRGDSREEDVGKSSGVPYYPLLAFPLIAGVGACGTCGGCGGCGGGVFETLGPPSATLWGGSSNAPGDSGGGSDWFGGDSHDFGGGDTNMSFMDAVFGGGGDSGDAGGDGGGCGGCGGCGG